MLLRVSNQGRGSRDRSFVLLWELSLVPVLLIALLRVWEWLSC